MAPFYGPTRDEVLAKLRGFYPKQQLPITLGVGAPSWVIEFTDGEYRLVPLGVDRAAADAAREEAFARHGSWMPEHEFAFLVHSKPVCATADLDDFITFFESWPWLRNGEKAEERQNEAAAIRRQHEVDEARWKKKWEAGADRVSRAERTQPAVEAPATARKRLAGGGGPPGVPAEAWWDPDEFEWVLGELDHAGELHGEVRYWRTDGTLASLGSSKHGVYHGIARLLHECGELSGIMPFVDGKLHGIRHWFVTDGATSQVFVRPEQSSDIRSMSAEYVDGLTTRFRYFDAAGEEIDERGEPAPDPPEGVPETAYWRGIESEWWDLKMDISGNPVGKVRAFNSKAQLIWTKDP